MVILYASKIGRNIWAVGLHGATARKSYALGHKSYACFSPSQSTHQPSARVWRHGSCGHLRRWGRRDVRELPPDLVVHRIARRCGHVLRRYSLAPRTPPPAAARLRTGHVSRGVRRVAVPAAVPSPSSALDQPAGGLGYLAQWSRKITSCTLLVQDRWAGVARSPGAATRTLMDDA